MAFALLAARGSVARADVSVAACFGTHMVLQRDAPLPVWGVAAPGEHVTVAFAGTEAAAVTDASGRWRATLPPRGASAEPGTLVIRGRNEVRFDDVLVGEVWLCAGQSNMLMPLSAVRDAEREIGAARRPRLRLLALRTAAGGDPPAYTAAQIRDLTAGRFCRGAWVACTPEAARDFSAVGLVLGATLEDAIDVPVGIVCAAVGGSPTEAWIDRAALAGDPALAPLVRDDWLHNPALAGWCAERAAANLARAGGHGDPVPGDELGPNHPFKPGFLWEACIAPLVPFAIRGVAWYQGESNADSPARVEQHARLLPALVNDWRRHWGRDDLPFAVVQLPGMSRPDWPAFRETQRRAVAGLEHAGLVVTIDLGSRTDVHPRDKRPVGERIARWALAETLGSVGAASSSPLPTTAIMRGDGTAEVRFRHAGGALATTDGGLPRHVEVAGHDGRFVPAVARIEGGTLIVVPPRGVSVERIRHAWVPFPEPPANLVNESGLPAAPFELDVAGTD